MDQKATLGRGLRGALGAAIYSADEKATRDVPLMPDLKLIALDAEDLSVLAAHVQDAVLRIGDMQYRKAERRFVLVANRFDWGEAARAADGKKNYTRRRCGLRFERVLAAKVSGLDLSAKDAVLSLLTIVFEPTSEPSGSVTLTFSGGGAVRLEVECIEAALDDLGAAWATKRKPEHPGGEPQKG